MGALTWKMLGTGAALGAAGAARLVVTRGWIVATGKEPPTDPENPEVTWSEAIGWAVASSVVITVARVLATRKAAEYYTKSSGHPPESPLGYLARARP